MFKKLIIKNTLVLFLISVSFIAYSHKTYAEDCHQLIKVLLDSFDKEVAATIDLDHHLNHRRFIAQFAKKKQIPVFYKQNSSGVEVPVILVNKKTASKLKGLMENSFGTQVALQKNWKNDHGLLRAGNYIIDLDSPGGRGYGEIENTGLAWKKVDDYIPRRHAGHSPLLEVTYLLTPGEKDIIDYYQKVRRAAIFRVKFTFGGHAGPQYPNLLNNGGEHCFVFCKASAVSSQISEIRSRLSKLGLPAADSLLKDPNVEKFIERIQKGFNKAEPNSLHSKMLDNEELIKSFNPYFPANLTTEQKKEFLNWFISLDSSLKYSKTMENLGVTSDYGVRDATNKRASAIFVYDEGATAEDFNSAAYSNYGKFVSWPTTKQYPVD